MLLLITAIKLVAEIALMAFAGQFVLGMLAGQRREDNFFYRLFGVLTGPFISATRLITPGFVLQRHIPLAAFCLLLVVWLLATLAKISVCLEMGVDACR